MLGLLASRERQAKRKVIEQAKKVGRFILGVIPSFNFQSFLARDKHGAPALAMGASGTPRATGLESPGCVGPSSRRMHRRLRGGS